MTPLDIILLLLIGWMAVGGFSRGFVEEVLSLLVWVVAVVVVRLFLAPLTDLAGIWAGSGAMTSILIFFGFFAVSYLIGRTIAKWVGARVRHSFVGGVDRMLGAGFGALKGLVMATLAFLAFNLLYNVVFGVDAARPEWLAKARSYPLMTASADAMSQFVRNREPLERASEMFDRSSGDPKKPG